MCECECGDGLAELRAVVSENAEAIRCLTTALKAAGAVLACVLPIEAAQQAVNAGVSLLAG